MVPRFALAILLHAVPVLAAGGAHAQGRPDLTRTTCAAARAMVAQRGEVIFDTGPYTFMGYVRDPSFCPQGDTTEPSFGATIDNPQCFVGYTCVPFDRGRIRFRR